MSMMSIRAATPRDREAIRLVEEHAFGQQAEAGLVDAIVAEGDAVVELVAEEEGQVVGHILFSRLYVRGNGKDFAAVALAPLAVEPDFHGTPMPLESFGARQRHGSWAKLRQGRRIKLQNRRPFHEIEHA